MARSRVLPSIISRVLIAHICFGRNGGLAPISLPLFQAVRREDSKVRLSLSGRSYSSGSEGDEHSSPRLCQLSEGRHRHLSESLVHVRQLLAPRKWPNAARLCLLLGDIQTEYALCELGNFYSAGRVDRCCTAAGDTADRTKPGRGAMTKHKTGTREEWLTERLELLKEEKELTRRSDDLARRRQELPWVRIDKQYRFDTDEGSASLKDLLQLLVYHCMFGPDYKSWCPSCSAIADGFNGFVVHLANHDVMLWAVSRAPLAKLQAYKRRMGWTFPWASSFGSDFNPDFNVSVTEEQQRARDYEYNYRRGAAPQSATRPGATPDGSAKGAAMAGTDVITYAREKPGMSTFVLEDGVVYHAYSAYARGLDGLWGAYQWLDRAPKGRNENGYWWRRRDEYGKSSATA